MPRFGPAGNSDSFYESGFKSSAQMPEWLAKLGLTAYEYQCGKGVNIGEALARQLGANAAAYDIAVSIHAPYYINLASTDPVKREKSKDYILDSMQAAAWMGAKRVTVHVGAYTGLDPAAALSAVKSALSEVLAEADSRGLGGAVLCPEVMGKRNQLGSLEEILELCRIDERLLPTVDFGHLHARGLGTMKTAGDFEGVLRRIGDVLGEYRMKHFHCHFSRIEFTQAGEKRHRSLDEKEYGPDFEPLAEALCRLCLEPVIICESRERMAEDALEMRKIYDAVSGISVHTGGPVP